MNMSQGTETTPGRHVGHELRLMDVGAIIGVYLSAIAVVVGSLGPWVSWERQSRTAPESWTEFGYQSSGVFTIMFAVLAAIMFTVALRGWDQSGLAWAAFALLVLCAITGLYEWLTIADRPEPSDTLWVEWGMIVTGVAGLAGAGCAFVVARAISQ